MGCTSSARELETVRLRALEALAAAGAAPGRARARRGRAGGAGGDRRRAVPRVRAPAADGGPRGGGQPRRGAARVRGAALAAARGARHDARAGGDGRARARCCAASRPPRPRAAAARRPVRGAPPGRRRSARCASSATRSSAARAELAALEALLARGGRAGAAGSCCWPATPASARRGSPPSSARRAHDDGARRALRPLRRGDARPVPAGRRDAARLVGGRVAGAAARARSARAPPSSGILLPRVRGPPRGRAVSAGCTAPSADAQRLRFFDAVAALLGRGRRRRARCCSCSTTCTGRTGRRCSSLRHLVRAPAAAAGAVRRHLPRAPSSSRATRCASCSATLRREGTLRAARARRPRRGRGRASWSPRSASPPADAGASSHALARRDRGQPVLHRGGRAPPARQRRARCATTSRSSEAGVPDGVREVTARRLRAARAEPAREALPVAAVIGREFDYDVLERGRAGCDDDALVDGAGGGASRRACCARTGHVGRYAFAHALVRATLYDGALRSCAARGCTAGWARRWCALRGARPRPAPGRARAPLRAGRAGRAARARGRLRARRRAARRPAARLGGGGAALPRGAARARAGGRRSTTGCAPSCCSRWARREERAGLEERRAGDVRAPATATARAARRRRRCSAAPRSASPGRGRRWRASTRSVVALLEEALAALARGGLARCARGCWRGWRSSSTTRASRSGGWRCASEAVDDRAPARRPADARRPAWTPATTRCGGPRTSRSGSRWRPSCAASPSRPATPSSSCEGAGWTSSTCSSSATSRAPTSRSPPRRKLAEALHRPLWLWWTSLFRCTRAQLDGRLRRGRAARRGDARDRPARPGRERHCNYYAQAMFNIRREQGRLAEVEGAVRGFIELYPAIPAWRGALALLLVELGRPDEARARVRGARRGRLRRVPARRELADRDHAAGRGLRRARATPRAPRSSTSCSSRTRGATWSSAARDLQRLRLAAARHPGRDDAASGTLAERHFDEAQAMHARDGRAAVARAHAGRVRGDAAGPRRRRRRRARARSCSPTRSCVADALGHGRRVARAAREPVAGGRRRRRVAGLEHSARRGANRPAAAPRVVMTMPRPTTVFVCSACGAETPRWTGSAPAAASGTRSRRRRAAGRGRGGGAAARAAPRSRVRLADVEAPRTRACRPASASSTGCSAAASCPGSLVLLGGSPGIGKSTLTSMALGNLAGRRPARRCTSPARSPPRRSGCAPSGCRARRCEVPVLAETDLETVLATLDAERPEVCVVDSVQTLHAPDLTGAAGSVGQVREVADRITRLAKARGIAVLLVGHVTKEGALAGPRVLEHLVDCVLQFEGERERTYRTLRALKNRFGSTNEVGVFEMRAGGLVEVAGRLGALRRRGHARARQRRAGGDGGLAAAARRGPGARRRRPSSCRRAGSPTASTATGSRWCSPCSARHAGIGAGTRRRVRQRRRRRAGRRAGRRPRRRAGRRERRAGRALAATASAARVLRRDRPDRRAALGRPPRPAAGRGGEVRSLDGHRRPARKRRRRRGRRCAKRCGWRCRVLRGLVRREAALRIALRTGSVKARIWL